MTRTADRPQNGTLNDADRATIQEEFDQLAATLDQVAPQNGSTVIADGNGGEVSIDVADTSTSGLGMGGLNVSDPSTLAAIDGAESTRCLRLGVPSVRSPIR